MAVFLGDAEPEDFLEVHQTFYDFFPLFIVDRVRHTALILSFFQSAIWIIEDDLPGRGAGQDLSPFVWRIHTMEDSIIPPEEPQHDHGPPHQSLTKMFIGSAYDIHLQSRAPRVAYC